MVTISVVIPFYNAERYMAACLGALQDQRYPRDRYEIIAVNNNSRDASLDISRRFNHVVRILHEPKQGAYAARNTGIRAAKGKVIAFTDPDCRPAGDWLASIDRAFRDSSTRLVLGCNRPASGSLPMSLITEYEHEKSVYIYNSDKKDIYFGHTNNMAVLGSLFGELGLFEERDRGSDTIFVNRCVERYGCAALRYEPGMRVRHLELVSLGKVLKKYFIYGGSRYLYSRAAPVRSLCNEERFFVWQRMMKRTRLPARQAVLLFILLATGWIYWTVGEMASRLRAVQSS